jgi:hypothetical protein
MDEKLIAKHMTVLGISREEAIQLIADDKRIDKGEKLFELDPELEKGAKKARQADRKPTAYNFQKRERKADTGKRDLISALVGAVAPLADGEVEVTNIEREFVFTVDGRKYKVVLSAPRS